MFEFVTGPLRSVLGVAQEAERISPLHMTASVEAKLDEVVTAMHRAAASAERHVEVIDGLAQSLPALTESVTQLTKQLNDVLALTAPLAAVERDMSRIEHLFGRRRRPDG